MNYIEECLVTLSPQFHGELVPVRLLNGALADAVKIGNHMDTIKKSLFYGRPNAMAFKAERDTDCNQITDTKYQDILHGIVGIFTEATELLETLKEPTIDPVNIKEEVGDLFWYCAILASRCGFTFEEAQATNIAKLRARFPDKFTEFDANNRNLAKEREILEAPVYGNE